MLPLNRSCGVSVPRRSYLRCLLSCFLWKTLCCLFSRLHSPANVSAALPSTPFFSSSDWCCLSAHRFPAALFSSSTSLPFSFPAGSRTAATLLSPTVSRSAPCSAYHPTGAKRPAAPARSASLFPAIAAFFSAAQTASAVVSGTSTPVPARAPVGRSSAAAANPASNAPKPPNTLQQQQSDSVGRQRQQELQQTCPFRLLPQQEVVAPLLQEQACMQGRQQHVKHLQNSCAQQYEQQRRRAITVQQQQRRCAKQWWCHPSSATVSRSRFSEEQPASTCLKQEQEFFQGVWNQPHASLHLCKIRAKTNRGSFLCFECSGSRTFRCRRVLSSNSRSNSLSSGRENSSASSTMCTSSRILYQRCSRKYVRASSSDCEIARVGGGGVLEEKRKLYKKNILQAKPNALKTEERKDAFVVMPANVAARAPTRWCSSLACLSLVSAAISAASLRCITQEEQKQYQSHYHQQQQRPLHQHRPLQQQRQAQRQAQQAEQQERGRSTSQQQRRHCFCSCSTLFLNTSEAATSSERKNSAVSRSIPCTATRSTSRCLAADSCCSSSDLVSSCCSHGSFRGVGSGGPFVACSNSSSCSRRSSRSMLRMPKRRGNAKSDNRNSSRGTIGVDSLCMRGWGRTRDYEWREEDDVVKVFITVEQEASSKDVQCVIRPESLYLKLLNKQLPLISGNLKGRVSSSDSYWTLETLEAGAARRFYQGDVAEDEEHSTALSSSRPPLSSLPASPSFCSTPASSSPLNDGSLCPAAAAAGAAAATASSREPTAEETHARPWLAVDLQETPAASAAAAAARCSSTHDACAGQQQQQQVEPVKLITVYLHKKSAAAAHPQDSSRGHAAACVGCAAEWGGVLEGEEIDELSYDQTPSRMLSILPAHKAPPWDPGVLLYRVAFPSLYTREDALRFIDVWSHSQYAAAGAGAAGPAAATAAMRAAAAAKREAADAAAAEEAAAAAAHEAFVAASSADDSSCFGLPATQMHVRPLSLPDGVRLIFEKPPLRPLRAPGAPGPPAPAAAAGIPPPAAADIATAAAGDPTAAATATSVATAAAEGEARRRCAVDRIGTSSKGERQQQRELERRGASAMLDTLALAGEDFFFSERNEQTAIAGYDAAGEWLPEDSIELRILDASPATSSSFAAASSRSAAAGATTHADAEDTTTAAAETATAGIATAGALMRTTAREAQRIELIVLRGPHATGGANQYGGTVALQVRDTEQRVLKKLQQDIAGITLAMTQQQQQQRSRNQKPINNAVSKTPCLSSSSEALPAAAFSLQRTNEAAATQEAASAVAAASTAYRSSSSSTDNSSSSSKASNNSSSIGKNSSSSRSLGTREGEESRQAKDISVALLRGSGSESSSQVTSSRSSNISTVDGSEAETDAAVAATERDRKLNVTDEKTEGKVEVDLVNTLTAEWMSKYPGLQQTILEEKAWLERFPLRKGITHLPYEHLLQTHAPPPPAANTTALSAAAAADPPAAAVSTAAAASLPPAAARPSSPVAAAAVGYGDEKTAAGVAVAAGRETAAAEAAAAEAAAAEGREGAGEKHAFGIKILDFDKDAHAQQRMPEYMRSWTPERKREFQREVAFDLEENIRRAQQVKEVLSMAEVAQQLQQHFNFSDEDMRQLWHAGQAAASRGLHQSPQPQQHHRVFHLSSSSSGREGRRRRGLSSNREGHPAGAAAIREEAKIQTEEEEEEEEGVLLDVMAGPGPDIAPPHMMSFQTVATEHDTPLHQRWEELCAEEQQEHRARCHSDAVKLELLLSELLQTPQEDLWPTICDQYKELLISENFFLLMKLRMKEKPLRTAAERKALVAINKFALSLFEDVQALALQNEREQLKKIKLLCLQALVDVNNLTQYAESMKHLLNRDFFAYLEHAIHAERQRIQREGTNPDAAPSQWLLVLLIIQKGVNALYEKEIWEDVLWLTMVLTQRQPEVRKKLLELFVAQLPKADWKQFKYIALRTAEAIAQA